MRYTLGELPAQCDPSAELTRPEVDRSVRMFIAAQGGGRKGDLSRFIEEAVQWAREH